MYDEMMAALLRIVLRPPSVSTADASVGVDTAASQDVSDGLWDVVRPPSNSIAPGQGGSSFKNLLKWKAFSRANREKILAEFA
jgi:hypothetical protein